MEKILTHSLYESFLLVFYVLNNIKILANRLCNLFFEPKQTSAKECIMKNAIFKTLLRLV